MNQTYTVKRGDTLYGISNQFGVSVTELASLNNVNAYTLQIGQVLKIPTSSGINPDNMFMYTVKKGDTLYSISRIYDISVDDIKKLNYLTNNNLSIGQVIRIPEKYNNYDEMKAPNCINYSVKKGDTLYSISKKYGVSVDLIIKDNSLKNNNLSIGQVLRIRTEEPIDSTLECYGDSYTPPSSINYVVKKGDSLYSIAKKFNTTVDYIKNKNNLSSNLLSLGQILKL